MCTINGMTYNNEYQRYQVVRSNTSVVFDLTTWYLWYSLLYFSHTTGMNHLNNGMTFRAPLCIFINFQTLSRALNLDADNFFSFSVLTYETLTFHVPNIWICYSEIKITFKRLIRHLIYKYSRYDNSFENVQSEKAVVEWMVLVFLLTINCHLRGKWQFIVKTCR